MIQPQTMARLLSTVLGQVPTIVVHPDDETVVRRAVAGIDTDPKIEVTELAEAGNLVVFVGQRIPITDLGTV